MLKRRIIYLTACLLGSALFMILLNLFAAWKYDHANGFYRKNISHSAFGTGFLKLRDKHWYLAGIDSAHVYLGRWSQRNKLLVVSLKTRDTSTITVTVNDSLRFDQSAYIRTEGNSIGLFDGNRAMTLNGSLTGGRLNQVARTTYFTAALQVAPGASVLRVAAHGRLNTLVYDSLGMLKHPFALEKQVDGLFSTDGMLIKAEGTDKLYYVYYYRNQFLCFNDRLQLQYKHRTVDTNSWAKLKIAPLRSTHQLTIASPPLFVNRLAAANGKWLFVASALTADNEVKQQLKEGAPIDVYAIRDGRYRSSFYLGNFDGEMLKDFRVYGNTLVGLYDHYLYFYQLSF